MPNEKFHNLYCSPDIITVTKSTRVGLAIHAAQVEMKNDYDISVVKP
jgi:hypothetical protein